MTTLTGTGRLIRLALRRDRIVLSVWLVSLTALIIGIVESVVALYATAEERAVAAAFSAGSYVTRVFDGPAAGPEPGSLGMTEAYQFMGILVALMTAQTVVRHTRQDEETGRAELLGAGAIGRHARLTAALVVAVGANLVLGAAVAVGLATVSSLAVGGSVLAGASFAAIGIAFAGIAAVAAQVSEQARSANAWVGAVLGVAFLLRAIGDAAGEVAGSGMVLVSAWPSWLSPIGWGQQVRPFADANAWILVLFVALAAAGVAVAFALTDHRDVGRGMVATRPGPARGALTSPVRLAWRQQRGILVAWAAALSAAGVAFGVVGEGADELVATSDQFADMLAEFGGDAALVDGYFAFLMRLLGIAAAGYTVQALLRVRSEESSGRVEPLLATAVGRTRWLWSHVGIALAGTVLLLSLTGAGAGLAYGLATGDLAEGFGGPVAAALVQIPAAVTLGAVVVLAFALLPRWAPSIAWGALAVSFVVGQFGELLGLPQFVVNTSPFSHPPLLPVADLAATPIVVLLAVAAALGAVGFLTFRRRDLATP